MSFANKNVSLKASKSYFAGFTLVELIITIAIFVFMTALVMARYNDYYSGTIFKNLAYDIAITIREAQSYGISVKVREGNNAEENFSKAYGLYIPGGGEPQSFSLKSYNLAANDTVGVSEKDYKLKHGARFYLLQVSTNDNNYISADNLTIKFQRPDPEAIICPTISGALDCTTYKYAKIVLQAVDGATTMTVKVNSSGQIAIYDN
jgi:hypothetical protein